MNSSTVRGAHRRSKTRGRHSYPATRSLSRVASGVLGAANAAVVLAIAVSLSLVGTGGTYAYLNASAAASPGATITAGTANLTVSSGSPSWTALAPGKSVTGTFTITNTGDVPLKLSATITTTMTPSGTANPFTITVANGACPASPSVPSGTLNSTLAAGVTTSACLVVTLPIDALPAAKSASAAITATISGLQQ